MDSVLVVCYSYTGTARRLAQLLAADGGWPLVEIADEHPRSGALGSLRCVLDSLLRRHPPIRYTGPDPAGFGSVVLLAPIWMYRLAGPMRTFVAQHGPRMKRVAVICTMGSAGASNAFAEIAQLVGHAPAACAAFPQHEVDDGTCTDRLLDFGRALRLASAPPVVEPAGHVHAGA